MAKYIDYSIDMHILIQSNISHTGEHVKREMYYCITA